MNYELRITNYEFEWHADKSRPFTARFGTLRNKFGMTGSINMCFEKTPLMYNKPIMLNLFQQLQSLAKQAT